MLTLINYFTNIKNITLSETATLEYFHELDFQVFNPKIKKTGVRSYFSVQVSNLSLYKSMRDENILKDTKLEAWLVSEIEPEPKLILRMSLKDNEVEISKTSFISKNSGSIDIFMDRNKSYQMLLCALNRGELVDGDQRCVFFRIIGLPVKDRSQAPYDAIDSFGFYVHGFGLRKIPLLVKADFFQLPPLLSTPTNIAPAKKAGLQFLHVSELFPNYNAWEPCATKSYFAVEVDDLLAYGLVNDQDFLKNIRLESWIVSVDESGPRPTKTRAPEFLQFEMHPKSENSFNTSDYLSLIVDKKEMDDFILRELNGKAGDYIFFRVTGLPLRSEGLGPTTAETKYACRIVDSKIRRAGLALFPAFQLPPPVSELKTEVRPPTHPSTRPPTHPSTRPPTRPPTHPSTRPPTRPLTHPQRPIYSTPLCGIIGKRFK